jgi:hypothetical protein
MTSFMFTLPVEPIEPPPSTPIHWTIVSVDTYEGAVHTLVQ